MSTVSLGKRWEAIGPFPSGMREHPLMGSPLSAFPRDPDSPSNTGGDPDPDVEFARRPFMPGEVWPSELGDGGRVGWGVFEADDGGWVEVVYPDIRWDQLRSDHGWAALHFQSLLRTTLSVSPNPSHSTTRLRIDVVQGIEYALVPVSPPETIESVPLQWYTGDVYAFADSGTGQRGVSACEAIPGSKSVSNFARSIDVEPGEYVLLVRAAYEIRMFGDPGIGRPPVVRLRVDVQVDHELSGSGKPRAIFGVPGLDVVPHLVEGWIMGEWVSFALRAGLDDVTVQVVEAELAPGLALVKGRRTKISAGQTRSVPVRIRQTLPVVRIDHVQIKMLLIIGGRSEVAILTRRIENKTLVSDEGRSGRCSFRVTFASPPLSPEAERSSLPPACVSHAVVLAPILPSSSLPTHHNGHLLPPVILALHGAGVDIDMPFWADAIPTFPSTRGSGGEGNGWAVLPTGRTEWGEDWHGASMADAWAARETVGWVAERLRVTETGKVEEASEETLVIGHSNGGQGAWYLAARYPDRIVGVIAASGWLKIQHYVPYIEQISNHFADPALMGILSSSLTAYNNDLYASNLAHLRVLAIHGAVDGNVPPRHGRAHTALIANWTHDAPSGSAVGVDGESTVGVAGWTGSDVTYVEVAGRDHWWDEVFREPQVTQWLATLPRTKKSVDEVRKAGFTLATANPDESGGKAGIRIAELAVPGRLARLDVNARQWRDGRNGGGLDLHGMNIRRIEVTTSGEPVQSLYNVNGRFKPAPIHAARAYGPLIRILSTSSPLHLVAPHTNLHLLSLARRIAHDLYTYHRTDAVILDESEALRAVADGGMGGSNVVVFGRPEENRFAGWLVAKTKVPLGFPTKGLFTVNGAVVYEKGTGIITLHPHPTDRKSLAMLIAGNDAEGLELAARLFPIRTGVPVPDWAVVSARCKWQAAGGLVGAGFWDAEWGWSDKMSWMDRE